MSKYDLRKCVMESNNIAGDLEMEVGELRKMQQDTLEDVSTFTVECSGYFSLICC